MVERLGIAPDHVAALRERYFQTYGTTLAGLQHDNYPVNPQDYYDYVHDLPLENYLQPAPQLAALLARLPLERVIFTNSDAPHARRVLARLGILELFSRIIDIYTLAYFNKPNPRAYHRALHLLPALPTECVLLDDDVRNLRPARELGMLTILVGPPPPTAATLVADYWVADILAIEPLLRDHHD